MPVVNEAGAPDVEETYRRMRDRMREGDHAGALEDATWYWEHALTYDPDQRGVRLSFFLADVVELTRTHAPALTYFQAEHARRLTDLERGQTDATAFRELVRLEERLTPHRALATRLRQLERTQPDLAATQGPVYWRDWYTLEDWELLERHPPDMSAILEGIQDRCRERDQIQRLIVGAPRHDIDPKFTQGFDRIVERIRRDLDPGQTLEDALKESLLGHDEAHDAYEASRFDDLRGALARLGRVDDIARLDAELAP